MEEKEEAEEEVVDTVEEYKKDVDMGILMIVVMINGNSQASMEIWLKFIHITILNKTTG